MLASDSASRLGRARSSLVGLSVGDSFGEKRFRKAPEDRTLPQATWRWTDDTAMAISIVSCLAEDGEIFQDKLANKFYKEYRGQPARGYGPGMHRLMEDIALGNYWRDSNKKIFPGGSFGNGSCMRVSPLGAYFADDITELCKQARLSSEVTHVHPEAIAGAIAVAVAAAHSARGESNLIERVLEEVPESEVKTRLISALQIANDTSPALVAEQVGNGANVSCQDTAPFCIWMAQAYWNRFEDAMWLGAGVGGDVDTNCAIIGGIIAAYTDVTIPAEWLRRAEPLPANVTLPTNV